MSEQAREPLIRLPIDQEIFMETVTSTDSVEDATVATEVVAFEKDGDVYELHGAVVFAGYVRSSEDGGGAEASFSVGTEEESAVRHIHHRLPFVLRVPVEAQQGGVVNVKSRLSGWALDVVSDHWLNVKGVLEIHGLVGDEGYHFQCGAQEGSRPFLREQLVVEEPVYGVSDPEFADGFANQTSPSVELSNEADLGAVDEAIEEEVNATAEADTTVGEEANAVSEIEAHVADEVKADDAEVDADTVGQTYDTNDYHASEEPSPELVGAQADMWRHEDGDADEDSQPNGVESSHDQTDARTGDNHGLEKVSEARRGHGWAEEEARGSESHEQPSPSAQPPAVESVRSELVNLDRFFVSPTPQAEAPTAAQTEPTPVASFEFEHQLDDEVLEAPVEDAVQSAELKEDLRSEPREIPKFTISSAVPTDDQNLLDVESVAEVVEEPRAEAVPSVLKSDLWSFVDFNGPEPRYTLRYAIVAEEETLEMVAERCGCLPSELSRINDCPNGQVTPGQALRIPDVPFTIPRVPSA
ncbi:hypothetical protein [Alicyclobacillus suci]|uniref:hypothetical protein n=1 Tax=Alicyclobacillus suci TaxID=2816080 RepID=UPI001A8DF7A6|nr:hypothetical protein [Alicyclobacillus suci]